VCRQIVYPWWSHDRIQDKARDFLNNYNLSGEIPVPIERIIEARLKMDIVPFQGLRRLIDADGFVTSDLTSIYVDENLSLNQPTRYRFTLAHEVGHVILHADFYQSAQCNSVVDWKGARPSMDKEQMRWLETHANSFASMVLMPDPQFQESRISFEAAFDEKLERQLSSASIPNISGTDIDSLREEYLADLLAERFDVSVQAAGWRMRNSERRDQR
jgi:Zn-dependent peptidase ImmA (M78 family)